MKNSKCAFDKGEKICGALREKECENCAFYKTPKELAAGRERVDQRLINLSEDKRNYYIATYHTNGTNITASKEAGKENDTK